MKNLFRAALVFALAALHMIAHGQSAWPARPIRLVVPFPAGGQIDVAARILAARMSTSLGQSIVVENRTGADGLIGTEFVAKSAADGYTWLAQAVPFTVMPSLRAQQLRYDTVRDFEPVALFATTSLVYVVPASLPAATLPEFIALSKSRDGQMSYAGSSLGSLPNLTGEMFKQAAGIRMDMIPYPGMPPALVDLQSGRTQFMSLGISLALPHIRSGSLRPLAVLDPVRHRLLPNVPSIAELGYPGLAADTWFGILVPAKTPAEVVQRINQETVRALAASELVEKFQGLGVEPFTGRNTPAGFTELIASEIARWGKVVRDAKITAN